MFYCSVSFGTQLLAVSSVLAQQRGTMSYRKIKAKQAKTKCSWAGFLNYFLNFFLS